MNAATPGQAPDREALIAAAAEIHDGRCNCDPRYRMSCPNMANAILEAGKRLRGVSAATPGQADPLAVLLDDWRNVVVSLKGRKNDPGAAREQNVLLVVISQVEAAIAAREQAVAPLPHGIALAALECIRQAYEPGTMAHDTAHKALDDAETARAEPHATPALADVTAERDQYRDALVALRDVLLRDGDHLAARRAAVKIIDSLGLPS